MRKKNLLFLFIILGLMVVPSVLAGPLDKLGDVFESIINVGTLDFLGSGDAPLIGFIRILIGIVTFSLIFMGLRLLGDKVSKNVATTIAIVMAIISSVFMPATILTAIGVSYAAATAFVLLGGLLAAGFWLLFGTPTETRVMAIIKLGGVTFMTWLIGNIEAHALNLGGHLSTNTAVLGDFGTWIDWISSYAYMVLVIAWIYFLWKVISPGDSSGTDSWTSGGETGKKIFNWAKERGHVPFTDEHVDKYGRLADPLGGRHTKRSFRLLMHEIVAEKNELKLVKSIQTKVKNLTINKTALEALPAANPHDDSNAKFQQFVNDVYATRKELNKSYNKWKSVKRTTFKHQTEIRRVIKKLEKHSDIDMDRVEAVKVKENLILGHHKDTEIKLKDLKTLIQKLDRVGKEAWGHVGPAPVPYDLTTAQSVLTGFDFSSGNTIVNRIVRTQDQGTATQPGVLKLLTSLSVDIRDLM
ncbi:hypothetical protein HN385_04585 [archaeon]|jgi:hypothetical protein|nr:hypothetical protein [archaeon]MBT3450433.1 hypothetical protein [archaeon]MBT6869176.1 hypothetical protein [archaeon]MBT7192823.1 hypothetical protein [archaeon]MBT7381192.1 hypothetical protein [archaeon]